MKILFGKISPISVSTHGHLIIYGKFTKVKLPEFMYDLIVKFLDWRFNKCHAHKAGEACNEECYT